VAGEVGGAAAARLLAMPHGHGVGRRDERERVGNSTTRCARTIVTSAVLERLAQRLERGPRELRQLVEEQHAVVGECRLARRGLAAAADQAGRGDRVVRRAERAALHQPAAVVQPGDRVQRVTSTPRAA
jgi:hypothetical protein